MNEPKFVPGERVILESKNFQEVNGEYVIESLFFSNRIRSLATMDELGSGFLYVLAGLKLDGLDGWVEHVLRKLPTNTPSTFEECIFKPEKVSV